jgi:hypothetical protein
MSLLDRLKPEYLKMIQDDIEKYPYSTNQLKIELSKISNWVDLKYSTVGYLCNTLRVYDYSPSSIDKLFTNEDS